MKFQMIEGSGFIQCLGISSHPEEEVIHPSGTNGDCKYAGAFYPSQWKCPYRRWKHHLRLERKRCIECCLSSDVFVMTWKRKFWRLLWCSGNTSDRRSRGSEFDSRQFHFAFELPYGFPPPSRTITLSRINPTAPNRRNGRTKVLPGEKETHVWRRQKVPQMRRRLAGMY